MPSYTCVADSTTMLLPGASSSKQHDCTSSVWHHHWPPFWCAPDNRRDCAATGSTDIQGSCNCCRLRSGTYFLSLIRSLNSPAADSTKSAPAQLNPCHWHLLSCSNVRPSSHGSACWQTGSPNSSDCSWPCSCCLCWLPQLYVFNQYLLLHCHLCCVYISIGLTTTAACSNPYLLDLEALLIIPITLAVFSVPPIMFCQGPCSCEYCGPHGFNELPTLLVPPSLLHFDTLYH